MPYSRRALAVAAAACASGGALPRLCVRSSSRGTHVGRVIKARVKERSSSPALRASAVLDGGDQGEEEEDGYTPPAPGRSLSEFSGLACG